MRHKILNVYTCAFFLMGFVAFTGASSRSTASKAVDSPAVDAAVAALAADVDGDGRPDVITVQRASTRGIVTVHRALDRSIVRDSHFERGTSEDLDVAPDFAAAGDLDGDGFNDVAVGTRGATELTVLLGDGRGRFDRRRSIPLGGSLTALAAGEVNRIDGLVDLVAGIDDGRTASLVVLESPSGALEAEPERIDLPAAARGIVLGRFGGSSFGDIAAYSDGGLLVVRGRDRKLATPSAEHGAPTLHQWSMEERIVSLAATGSDLALRGTDGRVRTLRIPGLVELGGPRVFEIMNDVPDELGPAALLMNVDGDGIEDRVVVGPGPGEVTILPGAVSATFVVNATGDGADAVPGDGVCADGSAVCTLRAAIEEANAAAGADTITFSLGTGTPTITPLAALPAISAPVTIQGNTGGATRIQLNGASAGAGSNGLRLLSGSSGSLVRSFVINRFTGTGAGIRIESANNTVEDCWVGLDSFGGMTVSGNAGGGIVLSGATATNNLIGGAAAAARNTISRNGANGIQIEGGASSNRIEGNFIGTNPGANIAFGNSGDGIAVLGASKNNTIGGSASSPGTGSGNVISGNSGDGIDVSGAGTTGNLVQGNLIGTNGAGTTGVGNGQNGVIVQAGAATNTIGGTTAVFRNVISGNNNLASSDGIELTGSGVTDTNVFGNHVGLHGGGGLALPNGGDGILVSQGAQNNAIGAATATPGTAGGNVISGNSRNGVRIEGPSTSGMVLQGNVIGLSGNGSTIVKNVADGVSIVGATGTTIGGTIATQRNVISGNDGVSSRGIFVGSGAHSTTVRGNYIGTDITGVGDLGNGHGISFNDSSGTGIAGIVVGGLTSVPGTVPGNVIAGHGGSGIEISGAAIAAGTIEGNIIGLNASGNTAVGNGTGIALLNGAHGIVIGGTTTLARNVISGNVTGISTSGVAGSGATIQGNYVGTNIDGSVAIGNQAGMHVSRNVTVGGASSPLGSPPGNLISGNVVGISLGGGTEGMLNTVRGNIIGATPDGLAALPNGRGVVLRASVTNNTVGGTAAGERNLISGNTNAGVECETCRADNSLIGNWIGVSLSGTSPLPNGVGVSYKGQVGVGSLLITGGTTAGSGNVISGNLGAGILVEEFGNITGAGIFGNLIGVAPDGVTAMGNGSHGIAVTAANAPPVGGTVGLTPGACTGACNVIRFNHGDGISFANSAAHISIRGNRITDNDGLGIDLTADGPTLNDPGETSRPTNFPVVTSASFDGFDTTIVGTLSSTASTTFSIEVFRGASDPSGYGEGDVHLGTVPCSTNSAGNGSWSFVVAGPVTGITATATNGLLNETSEFALNFDDSDSDTFADASDNCPTVFNPGQIDQDFDGRGDDCDCAPSDGGAFAIPPEVTGGLTPTNNKYTFTWTAVNAGSATIYDFLRGEIPSLPVDGGATETCINYLIAPPGVDTSTPLPGQMFWYLVRARNVCGTSTYGYASSGTERVSGACN